MITLITLRELALKMTKETFLIVFGFILLLVFLDALFTWLEWKK